MHSLSYHSNTAYIFSMTALMVSFICFALICSSFSFSASSCDSHLQDHPPNFLSNDLASCNGVSALESFSIGDRGASKKNKDPVVSPQWLFSHLGDPKLKILDASWYMPAAKRNPYQEYKDSHIPGAIFFDVDGVLDVTSKLPHMLPSELAFAAAVSSLGITNNDFVVIYDGKGIFSAPRVWWMFHAFGHDNVFVLDGGLPQWRAFGFPVEKNNSGEILTMIENASEAVKKAYLGEQIAAPTFKASLQCEQVWSADQVKRNIEDKEYVLVDARCKARFDGLEPEPRKGVRGGHVPGSKCVPFNEVLKDGLTLLEVADLKEKFEEAGVSLESPIVTSCGTGVTACVLALALDRLGIDNVAVYDGSWTEWGSLSDTPVATKPEF